MTYTDEPARDTVATGGASGPRAGFWQRFGAALIDGLLLGVLDGVLELGLRSAGYALALLLTIAYYAYLEGGPSGQTIGKRIIGIRVVDIETGEAIGYTRGAVRYLGRIVSGLALFIGYLWMLWDRERQCWHDKFAGDVVVPASIYPPPPGGPFQR